MPRTKGTPKTGGRSKGSRNKVGRNVRELAQMHTPAAISVLAHVMNDDQAPPAARVMAANALLDRGHGKAPQAIPEAPPVQVNLEIVRQRILEPVRNFLESVESVVILCPRARRFARGPHVDDEKSRSL